MYIYTQACTCISQLAGRLFPLMHVKLNSLMYERVSDFGYNVYSRKCENKSTHWIVRKWEARHIAANCNALLIFFSISVPGYLFILQKKRKSEVKQYKWNDECQQPFTLEKWKTTKSICQAKWWVRKKMCDFGSFSQFLHLPKKM